jgi:hypothetical protein
MPIGAIVASLIVGGFNLASGYFSGSSLVVAQCIILFSLNAAMMSLGRIPALSFVPGMFFGFASYFATLFGGFGPTPGNLMVALGATILMNAIGPLKREPPKPLFANGRPSGGERSCERGAA